MRLCLQRSVFPILILPFVVLAPAQAQQLTGTSHPEQIQDASQGQHYVEPSHAAGASPSAAPTAVPAYPVYQDSYPATESSPRLLPRADGTPATQPAALPATAVTGSLAVPSPAQYVPYAAAPSQLASAQPGADPDGEVVLSVPSLPHQLSRGTLLHATLREGMNTQLTPEGAVFTAQLTSDAGHDGEVMLPVGSLIRGHVTEVHGGRRITGGAALHLRPETISLPDGTLYSLRAQVADLSSTQDLRVNDEGTVVLRSNPKAAAAVVGGVTATAAVTGAVVGGGVGAAVGAVAGAGIATAVYLKREVQEVLPAGTDVIFALEQPLTVTPH